MWRVFADKLKACGSEFSDNLGDYGRSADELLKLPDFDPHERGLMPIFQTILVQRCSSVRVNSQGLDCRTKAQDGTSGCAIEKLVRISPNVRGLQSKNFFTQLVIPSDGKQVVITRSRSFRLDVARRSVVQETSDPILPSLVEKGFNPARLVAELIWHDSQKMRSKLRKYFLRLVVAHVFNEAFRIERSHIDGCQAANVELKCNVWDVLTSSGTFCVEGNVWD